MVELITSAAPTGQYTIDRSGSLVFKRAALDWHQLQNEQEAFFLRIYGTGDYRWKGADLGVLVAKGRMQHSIGDNPFSLTIRAKHLITAIRDQYSGVPLREANPSAPQNPANSTIK